MNSPIHTEPDPQHVEPHFNDEGRMSTVQGSSQGRTVGSQGRAGALRPATLLLIAACVLTACTANPRVTSVGKSVATLEKYEGMTGCSQAPAPDPQGWWNALPAANRQYPFAGWETWRNLTGGCLNTRIDTYRAVATFNLASVANLRGLVQKAELVVTSRAIPPNAGPGGAVTIGIAGQTGSVTLFCPQNLGGAGSLVRFGPNTPVPNTSSTGSLTMLGSDPFPAGTNVVYTLPSLFTPGPIANATNPSTIAPTGDGRATITTDVTGSVTAALNAGATSMSWMLTSNFEGMLPGQLPASGTVDCRTSYDFDLRITHM